MCIRDRYYTSLDDRFATYYSDDIQEALAVLQRLSQLAREHGQNELADEIDESLYDNINMMGM